MHHDSQAVNLPVGFEFVRKTEIQKDEKTGKETRVSPTNKNEIARELLRQAHFMHHIPFRWVLADSWYSNAANMKFIHSKLKKHFLLGLKSNRKVALSKGQLRRKDFVKLVDLKLQPGQVQQIWLDRVPFPLYVAKEVYVNADQSKGELYLVTNKGYDLQQMISLCRALADRTKPQIAQKQRFHCRFTNQNTRNAGKSHCRFFLCTGSI
ncbi:MAG: transposase [Bacteroidia bacterium]